METHFAVIGYPLGHTMSPFIHTRLFALSGLDATYESLETPPAQLAARIKQLAAFSGYNITIPHKQTVLPMLDRLDASAQLYGAVNTVACAKDGIIGYNTDADGFLAALKLYSMPLSGRVLLCGAGGVARTIAIAALSAGCRLTLAVRNPESERVRALCLELSARFGQTVPAVPLQAAGGDFTLAVNGTPVGMYPNSGESPLTATQLNHCRYVFDTVYNPRHTALTRLADGLGVPAVSGMAMLVLQAARAHFIWYGGHFCDADILQLIDDANTEMGQRFHET